MGITAGVTLDLSGALVKTIEVPVTASTLFGTKKILKTATLVNAGVTDLVGRVNVTIQNNSLNAIYVSNKNTVSITTGLLVAAGASTTITVDANVPTPLYAISAGISSNVSILEV